MCVDTCEALEHHEVDCHAVGCDGCFPHSTRGLGYHYKSAPHDWIGECRTCPWVFGPDPDRDTVRQEVIAHSLAEVPRPVSASGEGHLHFSGTGTATVQEVIEISGAGHLKFEGRAVIKVRKKPQPKPKPRFITAPRLVPVATPSTNEDVPELTRPPGHPVGCMCEWCAAVMRTNRRKIELARAKNRWST